MEFLASITDPQCLHTQWIKKLKIYTKKCFDLSWVMNEQRLSQMWNLDIQVSWRILIWKYIDKEDKYLKGHPMKFYLKMLLKL